METGIIPGLRVKYALEKSSFHVMIAPLAPTLPPWGPGVALRWFGMTYLNRKFCHDYVQVIRQNRNRGVP
jgi:hypothetical protein